MHFSKAVVKGRIPILILALLLMIPSVLGMAGTRINYDMLDYLPSDMETVIGQNALMEDFGKGAFSFIIMEDMPGKDVAKLKAQIEQVPHVDTVIWYDSLFDLSVPMELLPESVLREFNTEHSTMMAAFFDTATSPHVDTVIWYDSLFDLSVPMELLPESVLREFNTEHSTMMAAFFDTATSEDDTMDAIRQIRSICGKQCFVSSMSALVTDLKDLCEREEPIYVGLAVALALAAMLVLLDNWLIPFVFLASIGMMILLNMGTNYFLGEISYITKALSDDSAEHGHQLLSGGNILHHQSAVCCASAGRNHGLFHFPLAQLLRAA